MRRFFIFLILFFISCEKRIILEREKKPESPLTEISIKEGVELFNTMRFKKSAVLFLKNLSTVPDDWKLNFLAGLSLLKAGKPKYAKKYLSRALELSGEIKDYIHYYLAQTFFENEEMEASIEAIEVLKTFEDSSVLCDGLLLKIKAFYRMEFYDEALISIEDEYLKSCPERTEIEIIEAKIHCRRGEIEKAKEKLVRLWMKRDFSLQNLNELTEECGEEIEIAITEEMVIQKMKKLMEEERYADALSTGERFFKEPNPVSQFLAGKALYYLRRLQDSKKKLEDSLNSLPPPMKCEAEFFLGKIEERMGKEEAFEIYRRVYEKYPDCEFQDNALFKMAILKRDENIFKAFIEKFPTSDLLPDAYWELAWSLIRRNDPSSITYLIPITNYNGKWNSKAVFWLTEAMRRNGKGEEADNLLKNFMESSPSDYYWIAGSYYVKGITLSVSHEENFYYADAPVPHQKEISVLLSLGIFELIQKEVNHILRNYPESASELIYSISGEYPDFIFALKSLPVSFYYPEAYKESVLKYAQEFSIDPFLIFAIIKAESAFQRFAISRANAMGVMQIIKPTAIFITSNLQMEKFELPDIFIPEVNIRMGAWYLKYLIDKFSELIPAISAYNAGPENVMRWCSQNGEMKTIDFIESISFSETRDYVKKIIYYYAVYRNLYSPPFEPEKIFKDTACRE